MNGKVAKRLRREALSIQGVKAMRPTQYDIIAANKKRRWQRIVVVVGARKIYKVLKREAMA